MFKSVQSQVSFTSLEKEILEYWKKEGILKKYLHKNDSSEKKFSFLDGPKTANNPLGVHHAWGRTYKDLWQRFFNMKGFRQRFQNGYDEQGLWVEVEVEKNLGLKNKKEIENIVPEDKYASLEKFINLCKERIQKYGDVITEQSIRLGQFMDWDNSYHTGSDQNNYMIWHFLKNTHDRGWLYKGYDTVPWCPRCGTAISQHEMSTEDYQELTHDSIYFKLPIVGRDKEYLVVWTTTPWTIPANVAVAVNPNFNYRVWEYKNDKLIIEEHAWERISEALDKKFDLKEFKATGTYYKGQELVNGKYEYIAPFDGLERVKKSLGDYKHQVVAGDEQILPVGSKEGTGLVHIAPGAGTEDFQLGKKEKLPVVEVIDEDANYLDGLGEFSGKNAKNEPEIIINYLKTKDDGKFLLTAQPYTHRYPACWRCKSELVWRVVDEWYIAVDRQDPKEKKTFREKMLKVAKEMNWQPKFVESRELDWLENLHDWLISKKRYWGLALPIWECTKCKNFEVVGSFDELKEKAVEGWKDFEGHSPHRPWIDQIKLKCTKCGGLVQRVPDVGNPWLDAGIVPYSTITPKAGEVPSYITDKKYWKEWFPPDFALEMYEQTRLWFYAMIAMSATLEEKPPVKRIFGHGRVVDEKGAEMHNSKGNTIDLDEVFEKMGSDGMRWLFLSANPGADVRFGYNLIDDVRKRFLLIFWNCYKFFIDYAILANWDCSLARGRLANLTALDKWILARLTEVVILANEKLEKYDAASASRAIEDFVVKDFSTWYIRRSRDRVGPEAEEQDRNVCLSVMYGILVTLTKLLAPFTPFITESMYRNLTGNKSVHLTDYPEGDRSLLDERLVADMTVTRKLAEMTHAERKEAGIKLRQPLGSLIYEYKYKEKLSMELEKLLGEEVNVKEIEYKKSSTAEIKVKLDTNITQELQEEGDAREFIRSIQQLRKDSGLTLSDKTEITAPSWPKKYEKQILTGTASVEITKGEELGISKIS